VSASIMQDPQAWRGLRVLVTGASGFIGSHLISRLLGSGAAIHALAVALGPVLKVRPGTLRISPTMGPTSS
jgi:nucleoside-diphosphate-sugar epimerase